MILQKEEEGEGETSEKKMRSKGEKKIYPDSLVYETVSESCEVRHLPALHTKILGHVLRLHHIPEAVTGENEVLRVLGQRGLVDVRARADGELLRQYAKGLLEVRVADRAGHGQAAIHAPITYNISSFLNALLFLGEVRLVVLREVLGLGLGDQRRAAVPHVRHVERAIGRDECHDGRRAAVIAVHEALVEEFAVERHKRVVEGLWRVAREGLLPLQLHVQLLRAVLRGLSAAVPVEYTRIYPAWEEDK